MKNLIVKKLPIVKIATLLAALAAIVTGCGEKNADMENYKANMAQFFDNVQIFDSSINAIDPNDENAPAALLPLLDSMNTSFEQMASLEVPDGFPGVDELADEASRYMSEAVSYYHQAYDGESFDAAAAEVAYQNYECANVRLQYIVSILHGNIPEEIFTYEDDAESEDDSFMQEEGEAENSSFMQDDGESEGEPETEE
ncbi:MAG: hypothetical protein NC400_12545 [Clostridium sp.]|nr:hypothetical protein [Clostridium sp.]